MGRLKTSNLRSYHVKMSPDEREAMDKSGKSIRELALIGLQNTTANAATEDIYERIAAAGIKKRIDDLNVIFLRHGRAPITDLSWSEKNTIRKQAIAAYNNEVHETPNNGEETTATEVEENVDDSNIL